MSIGCIDCGAEYGTLGLDIVLPDQQWRAICPEGGILCANCICRRADRFGGTAILAWVNKIDWAVVPNPSGKEKPDVFIREYVAVHPASRQEGCDRITSVEIAAIADFGEWLFARYRIAAVTPADVATGSESEVADSSPQRG